MGHFKRRVRYPEALRNTVIERVMSGEMTVLEASAHYGIGGSMTIYRWVKKYEASQPSEPSTQTEVSMAKEQPKRTEEERSELSSVKRLLELERLRSEALMKMIKLAEEKYGIAIEKKSGPKQSKR